MFSGPRAFSVTSLNARWCIDAPNGDKGTLKIIKGRDRFRVGWLNGFFTGRGTARAEDAQGTPTQSYISPSILVYEDKIINGRNIYIYIYIQTEASVTGVFAGRALGPGHVHRLLAGRPHPRIKGRKNRNGRKYIYKRTLKIYERGAKNIKGRKYIYKRTQNI